MGLRNCFLGTHLYSHLRVDADSLSQRVLLIRTQLKLQLDVHLGYEQVPLYTKLLPSKHVCLSVHNFTPVKCLIWYLLKDDKSAPQLYCCFVGGTSQLTVVRCKETGLHSSEGCFCVITAPNLCDEASALTCVSISIR